MLYLVALVCPPLAVLMCGKPFQALVNLGLCLIILVPGWIHAFGVVHNYYADVRVTRVIRGR